MGPTPEPIDRLPRARRRAALAVAALALVAAGSLGACGSDDEPAAEDTTTTEAEETTTTEAEETTTTEAEEPEEAGGGDLVGEWTADAADILSANMSNLGGAGSLECSGPVTLSFADDGTFSHQSQATCSAMGMSATATIDSTGTYEVEGDQLRVGSVENAGSIEVAGTSQPLAAGLSEGVETTFAVEGDTLTLTFTDASVGTVSQTYTRA